MESSKQKCIIIEENVNPISLLKYFNKVYTKTSEMGFEALFVGCECICFGMPFYAGWGITSDRSVCARRTRKLSVEEVFAGAYILYTKYYNPYSKKQSSIIDTFETFINTEKYINKMKEVFTSLASQDGKEDLLYLFSILSKKITCLLLQLLRKG